MLLEDYRKLEGTYDKLVSIEMIEAVGHAFLPDYFRQLSRLLKPGGRLLIQAITIADQRHAQYLRGVDFIQRYIFPGGCLPSVSQMAGLLARETDMQLVRLHDHGHHYARTLTHWCERFLALAPELPALGYSQDFIRLWHFYFAYCEGALGAHHQPGAAGSGQTGPTRLEWGSARRRSLIMWQWAHLLGFNLYWLLAVKWQQRARCWHCCCIFFLPAAGTTGGSSRSLLPAACSMSCSGNSGCFISTPVFRSGWCCSGAVCPDPPTVCVGCGPCRAGSRGCSAWLGSLLLCGGSRHGAVHLPWGIGISAALLAVIWMWWLPVLLWVTVKLEGEAR